MTGSRDPIRGARRAPLWSWLVLAVVVAAATVFVNQVFLPGQAWRPIWEATGGWIHPTLLAGLGILLLALLVLVPGARMHLGELGLQPCRLPQGLFYGAVLWAGVQVVLTGWAVLVDGRPRIHGAWSSPGIPGGSLLGQLGGNALMEEVLYRGFVFGQFVVLFGGKGRVALPRVLLIAVAAGLVFALSHVPNRLMKDVYHGPLDVLVDQSKLLVSGLLFALVYWKTRNLPFAVILHSLTNRPSMVFELPDAVTLPPEAVTFGGGMLLALAWGRLPGTKSSTKAGTT